MSNWIRKLFPHTTRPITRSMRLGVESLDSRDLMSATAAIFHDTLVVTGDATTNRISVVHAASRLTVIDDGVIIARLPDDGVTKIRLDNKMGNDAIVDRDDLTVVEVSIVGVPFDSAPQGTGVHVRSSTDFGFTTVSNQNPSKSGYSWTAYRDGVLVAKATNTRHNTQVHTGTPVSPNFGFNADVAGTYTIKLTVLKDDGKKVVSVESFAVTFVAPTAVTISGPAQQRVGTAVTLASALTGPGLYPNLTTDWVVVDQNGIVVNRSTGSNVTFTPTAIGSYTVFATVTLPDESQLTSTRTVNAITPSGRAEIVRGTLVVTGGAGDNRFSVVHGLSRLIVGDNSVVIADLPDTGVTKIRLDNKDGNDAIVGPADLTVVGIGINNLPTGSVRQGSQFTVRSSTDFGFTTVKSVSQFAPSARAGYVWTVTRDGAIVARGSEKHVNSSVHPGTRVTPDFAIYADAAGQYTVKLVVTKLDGTTVTDEESFVATFVAPKVVTISGLAQQHVGTAVTFTSTLTGSGSYPNLTTDWVVKDKDGIVVNRSTGPNVAFTPTAIGSYTVIATVILPDESQLTSTRTLNALAPSGTAAIVRGILVVTGGAGDNRFRVVHADSRLRVSDNGILIADLSDVGATKIRLDNKAGNDAIVDPAGLTVVEIGITGGPASSVSQGALVSVSSSINFGFTTVKSVSQFAPSARAGYVWTVTRDGAIVARGSEKHVNSSVHPGTRVSPDFAIYADVAGQYTMKLEVTKIDGTTVTAEESFAVTYVAPTAATISGLAEQRVGTAVTLTSGLKGQGTYPNLTTDWVVKDIHGIVVTNSTGSSVTFTPIEMGTYTVFATVTLSDGTQFATTRTLNVIAPSGTAAIVRGVLIVTGGAGDNRFSVVHRSSRLYVGDNSVLIADLPDTGVTKIRLANKAGSDAIVDPADLTVIDLGIAGGPAVSVTQGTHVSVSSSIDFHFTAVSTSTAKGGYSWRVTRDGQQIASASNQAYTPHAHLGARVSPDFEFDADLPGTYTMTLIVTKTDGTQVKSIESFAVTYVAPTAVSISGPAEQHIGTAVTLSSGLTGPGLFPNLTTGWVVKNSNGIEINRSTGRNVTFTPNMLGSYTVIATVALPDGSKLTSTRTVNVIAPSGTAAIIRGILVVTGGAGDNRFHVDHINSRLIVTDNWVQIADLPVTGVTKIRMDNVYGNDILNNTAGLTLVNIGILGGPAGTVSEGSRVNVSSSIDYGFKTTSTAGATGGYVWSVTRDGAFVASTSHSVSDPHTHPGSAVSPDFTFDAYAPGTYTMRLSVTKSDGTKVICEESFTVEPPPVVS